jgi:hypothetical protein
MFYTFTQYVLMLGPSLAIKLPVVSYVASFALEDSHAISI